jgi:hypothetical protein
VNTWLGRSGQTWKMHLAEVSTFGMFAVLGTALALPRFFPSCCFRIW